MNAIENSRLNENVKMPNGAYLDKRKRYGWSTKDCKGAYLEISKWELKIDDSYQRDAVLKKVIDIASEWSWVACGTIAVAVRDDGRYYVIDGQHRVLAAMRRSDIDTLPCMLFMLGDLSEEAKGFLNVNTNRKSMSCIAKYKAQITANDDVAIFVNKTLERHGITISKDSKTPMSLKSVGSCVKIAANNRESFDVTMAVCAMLCKNVAIKETLIQGLAYLHTHGLSLNSKSLVSRIEKIGAETLVDAARRASVFYSKGGEKVWADGILAAINKGLRIKFSLDQE